MIDQPNAALWADLRTRRPQFQDALAMSPISVGGVETALSVAMNDAGHLHLVVPVTRGPSGTRPSDLNGLKVRHSRLGTGEMLVLSAPPSHEQVFTPFCRDVIEAIVTQQREPWRAVAATIRAWQSAWRPARPEMEKNVQVGLFGELLVLNTLMLPCLGPFAVNQWSGPDGERHDFVGEHLHLEVKTTRKSRPEHEISRIDQLRVPAGNRLLFVSIQLEETVGGQQTLATQIDQAIDALRQSPGALDTFQEKLVQVGWSEEMRQSGELVRFNVRSADVYDVDEEFPRLPDDFSLPTGVVSIRYVVDLANLPRLDRDEASDIIAAANAILLD